MLADRRERVAMVVKMVVKNRRGDLHKLGSGLTGPPVAERDDVSEELHADASGSSRTAVDDRNWHTKWHTEPWVPRRGVTLHSLGQLRKGCSTPPVVMSVTAVHLALASDTATRDVTGNAATSTISAANRCDRQADTPEQGGLHLLRPEGHRRPRDAYQADAVSAEGRTSRTGGAASAARSFLECYRRSRYVSSTASTRSRASATAGR